MQRYHFNPITPFMYATHSDITTSETYTQEIVVNFETRHGKRAWFAVSKPQRLDFVHGQEHENWNEAVLDNLETMLERIVKPLDMEKMRMYVEIRTAQGQFGFNLDFWYEKEEKKPQQQAQPTTQEIVNIEKNIQNNTTIQNRPQTQNQQIQTQQTIQNKPQTSLTSKYGQYGNHHNQNKGGR